LNRDENRDRQRRPPGGDKISIFAAVDARGKAGILAVLLDGKARYRENLF
jgi:hypothetical protein